MSPSSDAGNPASGLRISNSQATNDSGNKISGELSAGPAIPASHSKGGEAVQIPPSTARNNIAQNASNLKTGRQIRLENRVLEKLLTNLEKYLKR
jgi:hypothetical protein